MARWGSTQSAPWSLWGTKVKRPNSANGGVRLPLTEGCSFQFGPPIFFSALMAVELGDAMDPGAPDPKKIATELHAKCVHASAGQSKLVLAEAALE